MRTLSESLAVWADRKVLVLKAMVMLFICRVMCKVLKECVLRCRVIFGGLL
jgi:hypothetical protein